MTSQTHTPRPTGPYCTGAADLMHGRNKSGIFMRIFYPSALPDLNTHTQRWTKWNVGEKYFEGLGKFFFPCMSSTYAYIANYRTKNFLVPAVWEAPPAEGHFPVVVFSPGLCANRAIYSTLCTDIASHGFIVAAIEHRDDSASATFTLNDDDTKEWTLIKIISKGDNELKVRRDQVDIRSAEASRALDTLIQLNEGSVENCLESRFDFSLFAGKIDTRRPIMAGHSFGGTTTFLTLANDKRFVAGMPLDPWMFPLHGEWEQLSTKITQPILSVLMENFQTKQNLEPLHDFHIRRNTIATLKNGNHQNQTDTPFLLSPFERMLTQGYTSFDSHLALAINNKLVMVFIWKQLGMDNAWKNDYKRFLADSDSHLVNGPQGTAKTMLGWTSLPKK